MNKSYYQLAREGVMGLAHENDQLLMGAARQARSIHALNQRVSELEALLAKADYETEMVKAQGRKTRSKIRGLKKALSDSQNHLGQALSRAERAEKNDMILRFSRHPAEQENMRLHRENALLREEAAIMRKHIAVHAHQQQTDMGMHYLRRF